MFERKSRRCRVVDVVGESWARDKMSEWVTRSLRYEMGLKDAWKKRGKQMHKTSKFIVPEKMR